MRAALLYATGPEAGVDLRDDVTAVGPGPGQVRVRVRATGVCHSDLSVLNGVIPSGLPVVLGHEGAGEIVSVGDQVTGLAVGQHVVISWTPACGDCPECRRGQPYLCLTYVIKGFKTPQFRLGDGTEAFGMAGCGTWAEELVVPWQAVIPIDHDVPFDYAALLGCGIPTGVGAVINTARVTPGSSVAVVGCGGVGLAAIQGARIAGAATILAVDPLPAKHGLALALGATHAVTPDDAEQARKELAGRRRLRLCLRGGRCRRDDPEHLAPGQAWRHGDRGGRGHPRGHRPVQRVRVALRRQRAAELAVRAL